jgi:hypothetical protein
VLIHRAPSLCAAFLAREHGGAHCIDVVADEPCYPKEWDAPIGAAILADQPDRAAKNNCNAVVINYFR